MVEKPGSRYRIEALAKGLDVLRLFDESVTSLKLREICDRTGIPMPTAFRVVATLEEEGFVERLPDGAIRPGVAVLTLGSAALRGSSLVQLSEQPLRRLAEETGETVNLGVLVGDQVLYLARLRNSGPRDGEHPGRLDAACRVHLDGQAAAGLPHGGRAARDPRHP